MCWAGRAGPWALSASSLLPCRELTEINRRHITESVNSIRRVSEAQVPPYPPLFLQSS